MSELRDKRILFTRCLTDLVAWGNGQPGWEIALGRDFDEQNEPLRHMKGSLHYLGLANDLALYIGGVYMTRTEDYAKLGERWKALDPVCRWGGDFRDKKGRPKPDGNHFSVTYGGKA
jgi:hypothetical protein